MEAKELFTALVRSRICGAALPEEVREACTYTLFREAFLIGQKQDLGHLIYDAAENAGVLPGGRDETEKAFLERAGKLKLRAMARCVLLQNEAPRIDGALTAAGIDHVFLKGTALRALYPEPWLRTSSDIDALVRREDLDAAIGALTKIGYECKSGIQYHDVCLDCGKVRLELHHNILENVGALNTVLSEVWQHVSGDTPDKRMTPAYFAFHQVAHAAYHFVNGGCGFRPFIDLWLLEKAGYDDAETSALCARAGIGRFYERMKRVCAFCFDGAEADGETKSVLDYVLGVGEYADEDCAGALTAGQTARSKRIFRYIFIPRKDLIVIYPKAKNALLVPYYQVRRWIDRIFVQKKGAKAIRRVRSSKNYDQALIDKMNALRGAAGLEDLR